MGGDQRDENDDKEGSGGGVNWCAILIGLIIVVVIIVVVLAFTVFKVRDPEVSVQNIQLQSFALTFPPSGPMLSFVLSISVSIKNPNYAGFNYQASTAYLSYRGVIIGSAIIPEGKVRARSTSTISSDVTIDASAFAGNPILPSDLSVGTLPFLVTTSLPGKISVLNVVKHDATSRVSCTFNLYTQTATVRDFNCRYKLTL